MADDDKTTVDNPTDPGAQPADPPPAEPPAGDPPTDPPAAPPKDGLQKRIDTLTKKRHDADREAAYWKGKYEEMQQQSTPPATPAEPALDRMDYEDDAAYQRALTEKIKEEVLAETRKKDAQAAEADRAAKVMAGHEAGRGKYEDYDDVALDRTVPITQSMFDAALGDNMPDVLYYLGQNKSEAARIASLSPAQQAKEIGKVEVKVTAEATPKTKTDAPPPAPTVGGGASPPERSEAELTRSELHAKWQKEREEEWKASRGIVR